MKRKTDKVGSPKDEQKGKESSEFLGIFTRYISSIDAIREFFLNLCPVVTSIEEGIEKKTKSYLKEIFEDFRKKATEEEIDDMNGFFEFISQGYDSKKSSKAKSHSFTPKSTLVEECTLKILRTALGHSTSGLHRKLLNRSILMSLVSYFEVLVAELAHAFYRIAPDAISTDDKVLSVNELKRFNSIDEVYVLLLRNELISY